MKEYGDEREVKWDTPCRIMQLGQADIKSIIVSKECEVRSLKEQIQDTNHQIVVLKKLRPAKKPCLPDNRYADYFPLKSIVYVFHNEDKKWCRGTVVSGYRSGDGCVSYVLDDYPDSKKGWGCGFGVPCVIRDWEYDYFRKHLNEFKEWLKMCDRKYNGDKLPMDDYFKAMKNGNQERKEKVG
jgi:hypothetical protein